MPYFKFSNSRLPALPATVFFSSAAKSLAVVGASPLPKVEAIMKTMWESRLFFSSSTEQAEMSLILASYLVFRNLNKWSAYLREVPVSVP